MYNPISTHITAKSVTTLKQQRPQTLHSILIK